MHEHHFDTIVGEQIQQRVIRHPGNVSAEDDETIVQVATVRACSCGALETEKREILVEQWHAQEEAAAAARRMEGT